MKTIAAKEAKNHFGMLIDDARSEPVLVERNGRPAIVVMSPEKYEELIAAEDALWETRAIKVIAESKPLPTDEAMKLLEGFIANA